MKIKFDHADLCEAVLSLKGVVGGSDFVEADNLLFQVVDDVRVKIMATDTVNFAARYVRCKFFDKRRLGLSSKFFINYKIISQYLSVWSDDVILTVTNKNVIISCSKDKISLPQLQGIDEFLGKFPKMSVPTKLKSVYIKNIHEYMNLCSLVVPKEHKQPLVTGLHLTVNSCDMVLEAADGFRLLRFECPVKSSSSLKIDLILYKTGCLLLSNLKQSGKFWVKGSWFYFRTNDGLYALSTLGGVGAGYPDVSAIIPIGGNKVVFDVSELKDVLNKASLLGCRNIILEGVSKQSVATVTALSIDSTKTYKASISLRGKLPRISLDIDQLLFAVGLCKSASITLEFTSSISPVKYADNEPLGGFITYVIMPYNLGKGDTQ